MMHWARRDSVAKEEAFAPKARLVERRPGPQTALAWLLPLILTGCPLSDPYFVTSESHVAGRGGALGGSLTSTGGQGGALGGSLSNTGGLGGAARGGSAGASGAGACDAARCAGACCAGACVDVEKDPAHCGACAAPCAAGRTCVAGACSGGWLKMAPPPPGFVAREHAAAVSFDGRVFIFGGLDAAVQTLNSAAIYDPKTDTWSLVAIDSLTPTARHFASAVWTGSEIVVAGGLNASSATTYKDAALYDPLSDTWSKASSGPTPRAAAPAGAFAGTAVFAGGLTTGGGAAPSADRYEVAADAWTASSKNSAPKPVLYASWAFAGDKLFVYGGLEANVRSDRAYRYSFVEDVWTSLPPGLQERSGAFGVADGARFFVWGGRDDAVYRNDGMSLGSLDTTWLSMSQLGAPSTRSVVPRQSGWAFALGQGDLAFLGGQDAAGVVLKNGGRYRIGSSWTPIPAWPSGEQHLSGVCVLAGKEIILWGGIHNGGPTLTGERWAP